MPKATSKDAESWIKAKLVDLESQYRITPSRQKSLLTPEYLSALKESKDKSDLVILNPDLYQDSGTVLMDRADYQRQMECILNDPSKFLREKAYDDPKALERKIASEVQFLLEGQFIDSNTARGLKPRGAQVPQLYGLPKLHKPSVPLRLILSMTNSPHYKMVKWLVKVLEPVHRSMVKQTVKGSFELVDILNKINIEGKHMASFDAQFLFTNVSVREVIQIICDHVEKEDIPLCLPVSVLERLLLLCTTDVSFSSQGNTYRQIDGVAMGSPLGPVLADLFMAHLEGKGTNILGRAILYKR
ncbi:unnamed protein product [Echinostoma caproni]|uniref:Reverse transcriptase domain-containing protein n=1 Tax=Echinostoma caproni TaxID=27848 RepID=A0A183AAC7_9TREM|nr:unnamed protein product [Echinostoma caproni]